MKATLFATAILLSLPLAAAAQPRVVTTTTHDSAQYSHSGPVVERHVYHPVRHRHMRHPVRHRAHPVVSRTVVERPNGVTTTTVVHR
jgi:hypothetical protein